MVEFPAMERVGSGFISRSAWLVVCAVVQTGCPSGETADGGDANGTDVRGNESGMDVPVSTDVADERGTIDATDALDERTTLDVFDTGPMDVPDAADAPVTTDTPDVPDAPDAPDVTPSDAGDGAVAGAQLLLHLVSLRGGPVSDAVITLGGISTRSGLDGTALLAGAAAGRAVARVHARGFADATSVADLADGVLTEATVVLAPFGPPVVFDSSAGVSVQQGAVGVRVPAGALVDSTGTPVTGPVTLTIAPIDPTTAALAASPGPLIGIDRAGNEGALDSLFMADVTIWRGEEPLQIAGPFSRVRLSFRVPTALNGKYHVGNNVPAWWYDPAAGEWQEQGDGRIIADPRRPDERYWIADVPHLSTWNADRAGSDQGSNGTGGRSSVFVLAVDDATDRPIAGVQLAVTGVSYTGGASLTTGADGRACVELPPNGSADVTVFRAGSESPTARVTSGVNGGCTAGTGPTVTLRVGQSSCVHGSVEISAGQPAMDATVVGEFDTSPAVTTVTATTAADGTFCLRAPRNATGRVYATRELSPGNTSRSNTATVSTPMTVAKCGDAACADVGTLHFDRACLSGTVLDEMGAAVNDAEVVGEYDEGGKTVQVTSATSATGTYCLDVPQAASVAVRARRTQNGTPSVSTVETVSASNTRASCSATGASSGCTMVPDLTLPGTACVHGNVQDSFANPADDATVTAVLDSAYDFAEITEETDADGNYCLQIPAGAGFSLLARREVDGLEQFTEEILGFAPSMAAACDATGCEDMPVIQFTENSCVQVTVNDLQGQPYDGATVQGEYYSAEGPRAIDATPLGGGNYCVGAPRGALMRVNVSRSLGANVTMDSFSEITAGSTPQACASGTCVSAPALAIPRVTCLSGMALSSTGAPVATNIYAEFVVDGRTVRVNGGSDSSGNYCLEVPNDTPLRLSASGLEGPRGGAHPVTDAQLLVPSGADEATCGHFGCAAGPTLQFHPYGCLSGIVLGPGGNPAAGATVTARFDNQGPQSVTATTGPGGDYCLSVAGTTDVQLSATGSGMASTIVTFTTDTSSGSCGGAACENAPPLALAAGGSGCVEGRVEAGAVYTGHYTHMPVPAGTAVYVYAASPTPSCEVGQEDPQLWGSVIAQGVVGRDGTFCIAAPLVPAGANVWVAVDGCAVSGGDPSYLVRQFPGTEGAAACGSGRCSRIPGWNIDVR